MYLYPLRQNGFFNQKGVTGFRTFFSLKPTGRRSVAPRICDRKTGGSPDRESPLACGNSSTMLFYSRKRGSDTRATP